MEALCVVICNLGAGRPGASAAREPYLPYLLIDAVYRPGRIIDCTLHKYALCHGVMATAVKYYRLSSCEIGSYGDGMAFGRSTGKGTDYTVVVDK